MADNTSAAGVVLGGVPFKISETADLSSLACEVEVDGQGMEQSKGWLS